MTSNFALPATGSVWEWQQGNPQGHEVVTVLEALASPASVLISGPSGQRWVPLTDWEVYAAAPPLRGHKR
jgi:hypothetical protein